MPVVKSLQQHKVLFDTHVFIWHMLGDSHLSPKFRSSIERLQISQAILLSPMTTWEISMLAQKGRIAFEMDCLEWVEQSLLDPGFQIAPLTPKIAVLSSRIPGSVHGDPVDRILIATAFENHAVLVTCDEKLLEYGKNHFINVHDPRS